MMWGMEKKSSAEFICNILRQGLGSDPSAIQFSEEINSRCLIPLTITGSSNNHGQVHRENFSNSNTQSTNNSAGTL